MNSRIHMYSFFKQSLGGGNGHCSIFCGVYLFQENTCIISDSELNTFWQLKLWSKINQQVYY